MGSHRVHGGWHPPCCRERSRHKSEQRPRHLYRTRDKSCSLPLHVLSLSRWPNLGLCSLPEITNLRIERALEGRPRGAAFDIRGEALLACDDVGVLQDSQHSRHHQITRSEAVTVKVRFVAKRLGERKQALLHKLHRLTFFVTSCRCFDYSQGCHRPWLPDCRGWKIERQRMSCHIVAPKRWGARAVE